jgi:hypothetical protein
VKSVKRRRRNPSATGWTMIAVTGATIAGIAFGALASRRSKAAPVKPADLPSVIEDPPTGPVEPPALGWEIKSASDPGYPWNTPVLHYDNWPTPGMFVDMGDTAGAWNPSNGFDSFITALLGSALAMAGNDPTIASAQGQDPNAALAKKLRRELRRAVLLPGSHNDVLYGQTNANYSGGVDPGKPCAGAGSKNAPCVDGVRDPNATPIRYLMNIDGRGLNFLPRHADVLNLIAEQMTLERYTSLAGERLQGINGTSHMVVFAPAVNLELLGPGELDPRIEPLEYADGVSTFQAPPAVRALGINMNGVALPV